MDILVYKELLLFNFSFTIHKTLVQGSPHTKRRNGKCSGCSEMDFDINYPVQGSSPKYYRNE